MNAIDFSKRCRENIPRIKESSLGKDIWIYGTGRGGKLCYDCLVDAGIKISGFIDRSDKYKRIFQKLPVVNLNEIEPTTNYIIIALMQFDINALISVLSCGYTGNNIDVLVSCEATVEHDDFEYKGVSIGKYTYGYEALLERCDVAQVESIGRFCSINSTARIYENHPRECVSTSPIFYMPIEDCGFEIFSDKILAALGTSKITIGNDVWIGANVVILPDIKIGDGAVIGAGAVITKDVQPYEIVGGIPAKHIRYRFSEEEIQMLLKIKWWEWSDKDICDRMQDFYMPVNEFCKKYS